ncbi:zinc-binding dehydrogenase, partial [Streptomyces sp. SID11233]|nr:zinc-binding dehydrogenase [Streptomyces sp. SID11233]
LLSSGAVKPVVDRRIPMSEAATGHRVLDESTHIGKVLLTTG